MDRLFPLLLLGAITVVAAIGTVIYCRIGHPSPSSWLRSGLTVLAVSLVITLWGVGGALSPKPDFLVGPYLGLLFVGVSGFLFAILAIAIGLVRKWRQGGSTARVE